MQKDTPKVSIVIPVHNEERAIRGCLKAIKKQSVKPYEIIVVDNNCTDRTIKIVNRFRKIKVIKEKRQGLSFSRNRGLNKAKGDLLLRIDADTQIPRHHVRDLITIANNNPKISGFSGYGKSRYEFIPGSSILVSWGYFKYVNAILGHPTMWGANMMIRANKWKRLQKYLINDDNLVHEDQDISLALASVGGKILVSKNLIVSVEMEGIQHFGKYRYYMKKLKNMKKIDKSLRRYTLKSRLKKTNLFVRFYYWIISVWGIYLAYLVSLLYTIKWHLTLFLKTH